ncbi:unnamed protein product [Ranitomeya imitator]|uniref:Immunoglobulin V-set domain-containing protein n=1 Tax=Ranitomeya imitator TaxID=111125 RepID=A0ABN9M668_9NEOB|nr:unnamed protein product [Ranitomeya imitator]
MYTPATDDTHGHTASTSGFTGHVTRGYRPRSISGVRLSAPTDERWISRLGQERTLSTQLQANRLTQLLQDFTKMPALLYSLCIFFLYIPARSGEIVITQTPGYISAFPGETVTISCRSSSSTYYSEISKYEVNWYQIKEGQPTLLLYFATTRQTGIPDRFSGTGSGNDFTLKIKE